MQFGRLELEEPPHLIAGGFGVRSLKTEAVLGVGDDLILEVIAIT
jgi:hypothetical protein